LVSLVPNGAGKTTAFNMLTGVYNPTEGEILFNGEVINGKKPYQVTALGYCSYLSEYPLVFRAICFGKR